MNVSYVEHGDIILPFEILHRER